LYTPRQASRFQIDWKELKVPRGRNHAEDVK